MKPIKIITIIALLFVMTSCNYFNDPMRDNLVEVAVISYGMGGELYAECVTKWAKENDVEVDTAAINEIFEFYYMKFQLNLNE